MLKHHLLLTYRSFKRYKSSFFINLVGLTAGLTCTLLIYLWVKDELQMDKFHHNGTRIYQMMENEQIDGGIKTTDQTVGVLAQTILNEFPEVEDAVAVSPSYWIAQSKLRYQEDKEIKGAGLFAGKNFFKVFSYPLVAGNMNEVLKGNNSIVISKQMAMRLFHSLNVLGKEVVWENSDMEKENHALITGVFEDLPRNSSTQFDFVVSIDVIMGPGSSFLSWGNHGPNTFIVLKKKAPTLTPLIPK
jgi:putative ABC transport system permease protein